MVGSIRPFPRPKVHYEVNIRGRVVPVERHGNHWLIIVINHWFWTLIIVISI